MFHLKGCPKCRGDLFFEKDFYGSYFKCLQCGLMMDLDVQAPGQNKVAVERVAVEQVAKDRVAELVA